MDNLENTDALDTINVYDKADLKEQNALFHQRQHSFVDYLRIYSPYLLCGIILILSLTTLFTLISFIDDSSNQKIAMSACVDFISNSRFTPEGKYFEAYIKAKNPLVNTVAHRKKYILNNCPSLLKELHVTVKPSGYKKSLFLLEKSTKFAEATRSALKKIKDIPPKNRTYEYFNFIVFKNTLVLKDYITYIIDFKEEDNTNAIIKPLLDEFTKGKTTTKETLKIMNLLFFNNYKNMVDKLKDKWKKLLNFDGDDVSADTKKSLKESSEEIIKHVFTTTMKKEVGKGVYEYLKTNFNHIFNDYHSIGKGDKKPPMEFEDNVKIKEMIDYFTPLLDSKYITKSPVSDTDKTLVENDIDGDVNLNSLFFAYQSLLAYFKKDLGTVIKFFRSLINMDNFITELTEVNKGEKFPFINQMVDVVITKNDNSSKTLESIIYNKLVNIENTYTTDAKNYKTQFTKMAGSVNAKITNHGEPELYKMEAKSIPIDYRSFLNSISTLGVENPELEFIVGGGNYSGFTLELEQFMGKLKMKNKDLISVDVKQWIVKQKVRNTVQNYIKKLFDEFVFYKKKDMDMDAFLESLKQIHAEFFTTEDKFKGIIGAKNQVLNRLVKDFLNFVQGNISIWEETK